MVAVGYGLRRKLNASQLQEIGGDNVILIQKPKRIRGIVKKIKKAVCSKLRRYLFKARVHPIFSGTT